MANRWVFLTAFLTTVFIVAGAFVLTQFFYFELARAAVFMVIVVMTFFGEDKYSYMLGIVFPPLWFLVDILVGVFFEDFTVLFNYLGGRGVGLLGTPLHAFARLAAIALFATSLYYWRKEVPEKLIGKVFWTCLVISVVYIGVLTFWYSRLFASGAHA